jgi:prepilin-type N-terminal cleavage/methylation domain-containing protein
METISWNNDPPVSASPPRKRSESGFTLLEMVVAMVVMLVGLLALAQTIGFALVVSNKGRNVTNTKLLVVSVLEQMETLRNTKQLTFGQIANTGVVDNSGAAQNFSGFPVEFRAVSVNPGVDGIFGTIDDPADLGHPGYTRQILITSLSANLKRIQVTLKSPGTNGQTDTTVGVSYLNNDANSNFIP